MALQKINSSIELVNVLIKRIKDETLKPDLLLAGLEELLMNLRSVQ